MKKIIFYLSMFSAVFFSVNVSAESFQPIEEVKVYSSSDLPSQLKGWEAWATDGYVKDECVFSYSNADVKQCYFISNLSIEIKGKEMAFSEKVLLKEKGYVLLPGSFETFPSSVFSNGSEVPVVNLMGLPYVLLDKGEYALSGKAKSKEEIRYFSVPVEAAVLLVKKDGIEVVNPAIDEAGVLRLEGNNTVKKETDDISYSVFRKIEDRIPMFMTMHIEMNVTGSTRVENLGKIIPENFAVLGINSSVPAYVQKNGDLVMEVSAGNPWVEVVFRQIKESLDLELSSSPSEQEVWVFVKDQNRRAIQVAADVAQVQTKTTTMPEDWKRYPGYAVAVGDKLKLNAVEYQEKQKDVLSLYRNLKLSFDGKFYSVKDMINGTIKEDGQMALLSPFILSSVEVGRVPQSVIALKGNLSGFEVRKGVANINTISRVESKNSGIRASGYDRDFEAVNWDLNLSPGYKLFHVSGADNVSSSWIADWDLWRVFTVVLLGVVFFYLFGLKKALIAEIAFVLMLPVMPQFIFISFVLCGLIGMERFVGEENKFSKVIRFVKYSLCALLALALLGFMIVNIRGAIYPGIDGGYVLTGMMMLISPAFLLAFYFASLILYIMFRICAPKEREAWRKVIGVIMVGIASFIVFGIMMTGIYGLPMMAASQYYEPREMMVTETGYYAMDEQVMYDRKAEMPSPESMEVMKLSVSKSKNAILQNIVSNDAKLAKYQSVNIARNRVQTGVGFPDWGGDGVRISLKGPVSVDESFKIYLMTPMINLIIALLQLMLVTLVLYFIVAKEKFSFNAGVWGKRALSLLLPMLLFVGPARASDMPSKEMLQELREKLTRVEVPTCIPDCAAIPYAEISLSGSEVMLDLSVHAQDKVMIPLPVLRTEGEGSIRIKEILINGKSSASLVKQDDVVNVLATSGVNNIKIRASLNDVERFNIYSDIKINLLETDSDKLEISESSGDAQLFQVKLKASKEDVRATTTSASAKMEIVPFFEVERNLEIGTIWQVTTTVRKINQTTDSASIEVPLLSGEKVLTLEGTLLKDSIRLTFNQGEMSKTYLSVLPVEQKIYLLANSDMLSYREIWKLNVESEWSVEAAGVKPINSAGSESVFMPSAGEVLEVNVFRPQIAKGDVITFDRVDYSLALGRSKSLLTIDLRARSSEGGNHEVVLPKGTKVKDFTIDGQNYPVVQKENVLVVPVNSGVTIVHFTAEIEGKTGNIIKFPEFDLKAAAVNIYQNLNIASDRWVLFANGPVKGPAVLFWSQIPVLLLLAFILGRSKIAEVGGVSWFVLLLGLSQSRMIFSVVVVAWFIILGLRGRFSEQLKLKKLVQIAIFILTLMFIGCLISGISNGLLGTWNMKIAGNGSYFDWYGEKTWVLKWYQDAVLGLLPTPKVLSLPVWSYRVLMVLWSIWLSFSFVKWIKWGAKNYAKDGMWGSK